MPKTVLPTLTMDDRLAALEKAKESRRMRAEVKGKLKSGELTPGEVLRMKEDPSVSRMRVRDLIASLPGYGETKTDRIMAEAGISAGRRVKGIGKRQEAKLLEALSA